jgi:membrane protease YdiL (CAAX protease family)
VSTAPGGQRLRLDPVTLIHQEGVVGVVALIGLGLRSEGPLSALAPVAGWVPSLVAGLAIGGAAAGVLLLLARLPPLLRLQRWQREMVAAWSSGDVAAVAMLSGIAEEALVRALLQPLIGLLPAAAVFALLHVVPDRDAWAWPLVALALGLVLGALFARHGYPAAAAAHVVVNAIGFARLRASGGAAPGR